MHLTCDENIAVLDRRIIPSRRMAYTKRDGLYEISDLNKTLEPILPDNVKVSVTFVGIRLKPNINFDQTLLLIKKPFF